MSKIFSKCVDGGGYLQISNEREFTVISFSFTYEKILGGDGNLLFLNLYLSMCLLSQQCTQFQPTLHPCLCFQQIMMQITQQ